MLFWVSHFYFWASFKYVTSRKPKKRHIWRSFKHCYLFHNSKLLCTHKIHVSLFGTNCQLQITVHFTALFVSLPYTTSRWFNDMHYAPCTLSIFYIIIPTSFILNSFPTHAVVFIPPVTPEAVVNHLECIGNPFCSQHTGCISFPGRTHAIICNSTSLSCSTSFNNARKKISFFFNHYTGMPTDMQWITRTRRYPERKKIANGYQTKLFHTFQYLLRECGMEKPCIRSQIVFHTYPSNLKLIVGSGIIKAK